MGRARSEYQCVSGLQVHGSGVVAVAVAVAQTYGRLGFVHLHPRW